MRLVRLCFGVVGLASLVGLASCFPSHLGFGTTDTAPSYSLSVSPEPTSIPVNGTVIFTATTNAPSSQIAWVLVGGIAGKADMGSPASQYGGTTFTYTAPSTPPIYMGGQPGTVTLRTVAIDGTTVEQTFTITAPAITTGIESVDDSVALGKAINVFAYAVGSTNNALTLQVNGITGGSDSVGNISQVVGASYGYYVYTAPATMPMTGSTVTLTVVSQADPTKTASLPITLIAP